MGGMIFGVVAGMILIGSLISAVILMLLARFVGKIEDATFGRSFLVALVASVVVYLIYFIIAAIALSDPLEFLYMFGDFGFAGALLVNVGVLAVAYIPFGKLFWNTSWLASVKANAVWIVAYSALTVIMFNSIG